MMEKAKYSELVRKLFEGTTDSHENSLLGSMPDREHESLFREVSDEAWDKAQDALEESTAARMQSDILSRISTYDNIVIKRTRWKFSFISQTAAAVAIAIIFSFTGYFFAGLTQEEQFYEVVADNGQKSSLSLPDGTTVHLNSGSRIIYSSEFNKRNRSIDLDGEAYFDVAKNTRLPFVVHANEMNVTALGTKFNIKAYGNDNEITATLVQGCIRAETAGCSETITPNSRVRYDRTQKMLIAEKVDDTGIATAWMSDRVIFSGETLEEIARMLERIYNIEVIFEDDACKRISFNGLVRNNSLDNILSLITATAPVRYHFDGSTVEFRTKKK